MLSLVPPQERVDARDLIFLVESWRPLTWMLAELFLLPLFGIVLVLSGLSCAWLLIGAAGAFGLGRYGPHWWPGKR